MSGADGPAWEAIDNPALDGLPNIAKAQVVQSINCAVIAEIVEAAGGEVILPPGFGERVGDQRHVVRTRFLEDGSYRVWTESLTPEFNHPGLCSLWERMTGPRRRPEREVWGVDEQGDTLTTMRRIDGRTGEALPGHPLIRVQTDHLRRGIGGWRRFSPPAESIEQAAGQPLRSV